MLAQDAGIENRLSAARAFRALMARGRIEREGDDYRLVDTKPVTADEPATVRRPTKPRGGSKQKDDEVPTYEQVGRLIIERLIEASAENAELRVAVERARTEVEAARREAMEVTRTSSADRRRAQNLEDEVAALRKRLEMTESNLRTVVQAAKTRRSSPLEDSDAKAILDILSTTGASEEGEPGA